MEWEYNYRWDVATEDGRDGACPHAREEGRGGTESTLAGGAAFGGGFLDREGDTSQGKDLCPPIKTPPLDIDPIEIVAIWSSNPLSMQELDSTGKKAFPRLILLP